MALLGPTLAMTSAESDSSGCRGVGADFVMSYTTYSAGAPQDSFYSATMPQDAMCIYSATEPQVANDSYSATVPQVSCF